MEQLVANMFSVDQLPQLQTRQALLILDLQSDFLSDDGKLPIHSPTDYLQRIKRLVPAFRQAGDVIWVRSEFEAERTVNDVEGTGESVITDNELPLQTKSERSPDMFSEYGDPESSTGLSTRTNLFRRAVTRNPNSMSSTQISSTSEEEPNETFLSPLTNVNDPRCCLPDSFGAEFAEKIRPLIAEGEDHVIVKTYYSAFNSTELIPLLRSGLVTELFICGVISNISVYATALDAVRHGYSITLLEDCLGYRSKARHDEAVRLMREYMGADLMSSAELIKNMGHSDNVEQQGGPPDTSLSDLDEKTDLQKILLEAETRRDQLGTSSTDSAISLSGDRPNDASTGMVDGERPDSVLGEKRTPSGSEGQEISSNKPPELVGEPLTNEAKDETSNPAEDHKSINQNLQSVDDVSTALELNQAATAEPQIPPRTSSPIALQTAVARVVRPIGKARIHRTHVRGPSVSILGPSDTIGEGDSRITYDLLPSPLKDNVFDMLKEEVQFQTMLHRGGEVPRLVAVQGQLTEDGSIPVYRHPADESPPLLPFSSTVLKIKEQVERVLGHPVNHVLIQYYRDGQDYISEHSDKTLDIARHSSIANISIGAQRSMTLRTKKSANGQKVSGAEKDTAPTTLPPRHTQRIPMPHNSMFILGLKTNMRWLHGIKQDKRSSMEKTATEISHNGERISLTFRQIVTFLHPTSNLIWGQGARSKSRDTAGEVIGGGTAEAEKMVMAFGRENQESEFDWDAVYGDGFDALDIVMNPGFVKSTGSTDRAETPSSIPQNVPKLYLAGNPLSDLRVQLHLAEAGVKYHLLKVNPIVDSNPESSTVNNNVRPRFIDSDPDKTEVIGALPIMIYIEQYYRHNGATGSSHTRSEVATALSQVGESQELFLTWQRHLSTNSGKQKDASLDERLNSEKFHLHRDLQSWEANLARMGSSYVAGESYTMADSAFWPVLDNIVTKWVDWDDEEFPELKRYHSRIGERANVTELLASLKGTTTLDQEAPVVRLVVREDQKKVEG
ncbi:MAG: hypothetical protein M1816_008025 [Peltula sp. TS41687]|nr:MAG: hypothetical protein M1816_008025 [Peltula sp. TS41687]